MNGSVTGRRLDSLDEILSKLREHLPWSSWAVLSQWTMAVRLLRAKPADPRQ